MFAVSLVAGVSRIVHAVLSIQTHRLEADPIWCAMSNPRTEPGTNATPLNHSNGATRVLKARDVARLFDRSVSWFRQQRARLERQGFPARDALLGGWPRRAVERWFDERDGKAVGSQVTLPAWSVGLCGEEPGHARRH